MSNSIILIKGKYVNLRNVNVKDSEFILSLRCNPDKAKYIHQTEYNIEKQNTYINNCLNKENEWYFIIENKQNEPIGTYRIYDVDKESFCIGSWLMKDNSNAFETLEGEYLALNFAFDTIKINKFRYDVRKGNKKVIKYHLLTGGKIVSENEKDYFFIHEKEDYLKSYRKLINCD